MTPFGTMLRQERKDRGMLLSEMAGKLGISSPYLSQLETGVRQLKEGFVEKVITLLEFSQQDAAALRRAEAKSLPSTSGSVTIDLRPNTSARDRELASNLALSFNRLKPETKSRLRAMLKDERNG